MSYTEIYVTQVALADDDVISKVFHLYKTCAISFFFPEMEINFVYSSNKISFVSKN